MGTKKGQVRKTARRAYYPDGTPKRRATNKQIIRHKLRVFRWRRN
jgi:hypothetical protein